MRYLVTGGTGFIGRHIVRQLLAAGHEVVALVRSPERAVELDEAGVRLVKGDITDGAAVRSAMTGADGVFHVAGWYRVGARDGSEGWRANVDGTRCVLEAMRELRIPKGVYTSTNAVFSDTHGRLVDERYRFQGKHLSVYDKTKWVAHYEIAEPLQREGLPLVIVQPGLVYGPGDHSPLHDVLVDYLRRRLPLLPLGTAYCFSHVEDTARGHLLAMEKGRPGESYVIGGPAHTLIDVLAIAERVTGIPRPRPRLYPGLMKALAEIADVLDDFLPLPTAYRGEVLRSSAGVTYTASDAKARRELGFTTRPLLDGLRETLPHQMRLLGLPTP